MAPSAVSPLPSPAVEAVKRKSAMKRSHSSDGRLQSPHNKRVRYDTTLDLQPPSPSAPKDVDVAFLRENLTYAINERDGAGKGKYDEIKRHFDEPLDSEDALSSIDLRAHLVALTGNAPLLKKPCADLVNAVLQHHWLARDDSFVASFTRFLGHLVSAQGGYLYTVLQMLVENFAHLSSSAGRYPSNSKPPRSKLQSRIHTALKYLLQLVPSASGSLSAVVTQSFPFVADSKKAHVDYVRNLLRLTEYAPELKTIVLDLIIERLLKIDVQVQVDIEDLQEDAEDILMQSRALKKQARLGRLDADDQDSDEDDSEASDDDDLNSEELRLKSLSSSVEKMDAILDLLFSFYDPVMSASKGGNHLDAVSTFNQLLSQFRKTILPTYRSRHTQFLLFHFAQTSPELVASFTDTCSQILMDKSRFPVLRVSAAAYLATFIARAAHVESDMVVYIFNTLAQFCDRLRATHEPSCRGPDIRKYGPYYAAVQALMYIFCFRWRDFVAPSSQGSDPDSDGEEDAADAEDAIDAALFDGARPLVFLPLAKDAFTRNFNSQLNPLKACAPEIADEFAKIAHHLNFMYIYPILEANKRLRLVQSGIASAADGGRETSLTALRGERSCQLDAYFPFDPYNLPISKRWLVGDYREWKGVPGLREEPRGSFPESDISAGGVVGMLSDDDDRDAADDFAVDDEEMGSDDESDAGSL